jgi:peroxiredoxin
MIYGIIAPVVTFSIAGRIDMPLTVGQLAPDFILKSHSGQSVRLSDYRGRCNVVMAFFPLAWTPV